MARSALSQFIQPSHVVRLPHLTLNFLGAQDWNTPALAFYGTLGATVREGLLTSRFAGDSLKDFNSVSLNGKV
jgi:hypothetical protein